MWETAVHLAVAGGVFDGVFLCCPFFQLDVLDETWDLIESVSEGFLTYSYFNLKVGCRSFEGHNFIFHNFIILLNNFLNCQKAHFTKK